MPEMLNEPFIHEDGKVETHLFILCYPLKRRLGIQSVLMDNVTKVIVV